MSEGKVRVAVIGCGRVGTGVHLPALARHPAALVVAFAEPDESRRRVAARLAPNAAGFSDYRELLSDAEAEAYVVCTSPDRYPEIATAILERGSPLYLEKPLAPSLAAGRAILEAWRRGGAQAMIGFNYRFNPLVVRLRRHVQQGSIGDPVLVRTMFSTAATAGEAWRKARSSGGGVLLDLGSHHFDLLRHLTGSEATLVRADLWSRHSEDDHAMVEIEMASGLRAQCAFARGTMDQDRIEVIGDKGALILDRYRALALEYRSPEAGEGRRDQLRHLAGSLVGLPYLIARRRAVWNEPSHEVALDHFLGSVLAGSAVQPDLDEGYRSLEIATAAEDSARLGDPVTPTSPESPGS